MIKKKIIKIMCIVLCYISLAPFCELRLHTASGVTLKIPFEARELLQHTGTAFRPPEALVSSIREAMLAYPDLSANTKCALAIGGIKITQRPETVDSEQECPVINFDLIFGYLFDTTSMTIRSIMEISNDRLRIERVEAGLALFDGLDEEGHKKIIGTLRLASPSRIIDRMHELDEFFPPIPLPSVATNGFKRESTDEKAQYRCMRSRITVKPSSLRAPVETPIPSFKTQAEFEVWVAAQELPQSLERFIEVFGQTKINDWKIALNICGKRECYIHSFSQDINAIRGGFRGIGSLIEFFGLFRGADSLSRLIERKEEAVYEYMATPRGFEAIEPRIPRILPVILDKLADLLEPRSIHQPPVHVARFIYGLVQFLQDNTDELAQILQEMRDEDSETQREFLRLGFNGYEPKIPIDFNSTDYKPYVLRMARKASHTGDLGRWDILNTIIYHFLQAKPQLKAA